MSAAEENSVPEVSLIQGRIEEVSLGEPTVYGQMAMFPLLDKEESTIDYLTLDESIANGYAYVTEIDEDGIIPLLKFKNSSEKRIFLMEGEELVGAKQNRTLNISLLAPAEKEITIPVTCVESGRWDYDSPRFKTSNRAHYSRGRREKMASVSESMNFCNRPEANQFEVWDEISSKAERMKSRSRTSAMGDIFENYRGRVSDYVKTFTAVENQAGMLVMVGDDIVGLDLFDNKETLKKLMPKLVRSFALDAIELNTRKKYQPRIKAPITAAAIITPRTTPIRAFQNDFIIFGIIPSPFPVALTPLSIALNPFSTVALVTSTFRALSDVVLVELFVKSCPQFGQNFVSEFIFEPH